jgi:hypothetical protein
MTHYLAIPVISTYEIAKENYFKYMINSQNTMFASVTEIKELEDLDFTYKYMKN